MLRPLTGEEEWLGRLQGVRAWRPPKAETILIVPHPDDEVLGVGGLIAYQYRRRVPTMVIAVTDGEAAYSDQQDLGSIRRVEQQKALAELGVRDDQTVRLGLPDSGVTSVESRLAQLLTPFITAETLVVAPWSSDHHPDHEACGRVAESLTRQVEGTLVSYLFWAWHHQLADNLMAQTVVRFDLDDHLQATKRLALANHESQLSRSTGEPILSESLLFPARRKFEVFILHE